MLRLMCYIETFYTDIILKQNKIVEHAVAKSYDNIHNTLTVPCEKSKIVSLASSVMKALIYYYYHLYSQ